MQSKFVGLAAKTYAALSDEHSKDFDVVKEKILQVYELTPEAYRRKFRNLNKKAAESYVDYVRELTLAFDRWVKSKKVSDYEGLRDLVLMEQFGSVLQPQLRTYLRDQNVDKAYDAAIKVDNYLKDHGDLFQIGISKSALMNIEMIVLTNILMRVLTILTVRQVYQ